MNDNQSYYRQRIEEELAAAETAKDSAISRIHSDMAERYRELIGAEAPGGKDLSGEPGTIHA